jgi:prepilin-type N-terminal cleavage/methylation domain-containing protein
MMKKKGFTLVELLGGIVILSIILLIAVPTISNITNRQKAKAYNTQVSLILAKAQDWALKNVNNLAPDNGINFVDLSSLVSQGYVDNTSINDPRNGTNMNGCIVIAYNTSTSQYDYSYSDLTCSEEEAKYGPEFSKSSSNGDSLANPETVEVGSIFNLPVVTAISTSSTKDVLTVNGPEINVIDSNGNVLNSIDVVDTSYVDRYYSLTYSAYDAAYKYTFKHIYYVKVVDTVGPVITMGTTKGTERISADSIYLLPDTTQSNYNVMTMKVTDDSCTNLNSSAQSDNGCTTTLIATPNVSQIDITQEKEYTIRYTAKDKYNTTTYDVKYIVYIPQYAYDSGEHDIIVDYSGNYKLEGYGAQGGQGTNAGGQGGYISGIVYLNAGDKIHVSVGAVGAGGAGASNTTGYANGGSSTRITKGTTTLLTAAGGGAGGSTTGGAGGSGTGAGGSKPSNCGSAGIAGTNGSGGGSSGSCNYTYSVPKTCYHTCTGGGGETCASNSGSSCNCGGWDRMTACDYQGNGVYWWNCCKTNATYTYQCNPYDCSTSATGTNTGTGGQGGTSSVDSSVSSSSKSDGKRTGNGYVKVTYVLQ